jgi:hypothetical protein
VLRLARELSFKEKGRSIWKRPGKRWFEYHAYVSVRPTIRQQTKVHAALRLVWASAFCRCAFSIVDDIRTKSILGSRRNASGSEEKSETIIVDERGGCRLGCGDGHARISGLN